MIATSVAPHLYWVTSRAAGIAALLLASMAVSIGVMMAGRLLRRGPDMRIVHEALSLATMAAIAIHAGSLLGDSFLKPSLADVTVPFVSSYRQPWMTIGIIGGWMTIVLGLSYYLRTRIGTERWKRIHRFTLLAWVLGAAHSLGEGTDAGQMWFLVCAGIVALPAAALVLVRFAGSLRVAPSRPAIG
jgi:sulfoxide reductase heme-binding subunit YedZ